MERNLQNKNGNNVSNNLIGGNESGNIQQNNNLIANQSTANSQDYIQSVNQLGAKNNNLNNQAFNQNSESQVDIFKTSMSNTNTTNKKSNKKLIIGIVLLIVIAIITVVVAGKFVSGESILGPSDDSKKYNIVVKEIKDMDVKSYISAGESQLIISVINKTGKTIGSGSVIVNYFDENGKKIPVYDSWLGSFNLLENKKEVIVGFNLPQEGLDYYVPAKVEVEIKDNGEYEDVAAKFIENFSYSYSTKDEKNIIVKTKNISNKTQNFLPNLSAVFYKNNRPVHVRDVSHPLFKSLEPGESYSAEVSIPLDHKRSDEEGKDILIDYDTVKVYRTSGLDLD